MAFGVAPEGERFVCGFETGAAGAVFAAPGGGEDAVGAVAIGGATFATAGAGVVDGVEATGGVGATESVAGFGEILAVPKFEEWLTDAGICLVASA